MNKWYRKNIYDKYLVKFGTQDFPKDEEKMRVPLRMPKQLFDYVNSLIPDDLKDSNVFSRYVYYVIADHRDSYSLRLQHLEELDKEIAEKTKKLNSLIEDLDFIEELNRNIQNQNNLVERTRSMISERLQKK